MERKVKKMGFFGAIYFVALGLLNFIISGLVSKIGAIDFIILGIALIPILLRHKNLYLVFGVSAALLSLYIAFACFTMNLQPGNLTTPFSFLLGYLLAITSFGASSLLIYAGLDHGKSLNVNPNLF